MKAAEAILAVGDRVIVNLVFLVEGEDSRGSKAIGQFVAEGGLDEFAPLLCTVISDTSIWAGSPLVDAALARHRLYEIEVHGPKQDVHSGLFGGIAVKSNQLLVDALAGWSAVTAILPCRALRRISSISPRKGTLRRPRGRRSGLLPRARRSRAGRRAPIPPARKALDPPDTRHSSPA